LRALHGESLLRGLPRDVFTERLTYHLAEVNAVHPFREGNGRAQRADSRVDVTIPLSAPEARAAAGRVHPRHQPRRAGHPQPRTTTASRRILVAAGEDGRW